MVVARKQLGVLFDQGDTVLIVKETCHRSGALFFSSRKPWSNVTKSNLLSRFTEELDLALHEETSR